MRCVCCVDVGAPRLVNARFAIPRLTPLGYVDVAAPRRRDSVLLNAEHLLLEHLAVRRHRCAAAAIHSRRTPSRAALFPPTTSRRYVSLHLRQLLILPPPHLINPGLEAVAFGAGLGDLGGEEFGGDFDAAGVDHDAGDAAGGEVPHVDVAAGVGEGDVEEAVELFAHGGEHEADAADARAQEVAVGRVLVGTLLLREASPLHEVEDRHGDVAIATHGPS